MTPMTPRSPLPHRARAVLLGVVLPAAILAGAALVVLSWRERLPDPAALHWGTEGVDRVGSFTEMLTSMGVGAGISFVVTASFALLTGRSATVRRMVVAIAAGTATMFGVLMIGTAWLQLDVATAQDARSPGAVVALGLVAALAVAVGAAALAGSDPPQPGTGDLPDDAAVLDLPERTTAVWTKDVGMGRSWVPWVVLTGQLVLGVALSLLSGEWWLLLVLSALALLVLAMMSWRVRVDATGLSARAALGWPRQHVPADEVELADVVEVSPFAEFGGWGMRVNVHGTVGLVTRTGEAVRVRRTGGRTFVVTVDDAATGAALLNTMARRARRGTRTG